MKTNETSGTSNATTSNFDEETIYYIYRIQIELLEIGLSIKDLANLLGMNPNSITNYKRTKVIPLNLAITISLISYLKKTGITPENIINEIKKKQAADLMENQ